MAKLRKTLGSPTEPAVVALMESMEGKSKETLTTWAMAYVTEKYLPLVAETPLFAELLEKTKDCMTGNLPLKDWKALLAEARKASAAEKEPVREAAARAIVTACGTWCLPCAAGGDDGRHPPMLWDFVFMGQRLWLTIRQVRQKPKKPMICLPQRNWNRFWHL